MANSKHKRFVLILEGPMGAGKSTISSLLHQKLPRTALLGMDKFKWFLSDFQRGEDYTIINKVMLAMGKSFLEQGCNLLIDQAFWKSEYVQPFIDLARTSNADLYFYQLEAPIDILIKRAKSRPNTPNKPPVTDERIEGNLKKWEENRYELGKTIDTSKSSPEEIARFIIQEVES